jgi:hypothetical protein
MRVILSPTCRNWPKRSTGNAWKALALIEKTDFRPGSYRATFKIARHNRSQIEKCKKAYLVSLKNKIKKNLRLQSLK